MSDPQTEDYRGLLLRAGVTHLSDEDVADLTPGLRAIDGKIAMLRDLAGQIGGTLPDPIETLGHADD